MRGARNKSNVDMQQRKIMAGVLTISTTPHHVTKESIVDAGSLHAAAFLENSSSISFELMCSFIA
jgi:hypothetical protein